MSEFVNITTYPWATTVAQDLLDERNFLAAKVKRYEEFVVKFDELMAMEEKFSNSSKKVEIPDEDAEKIATIQDAVDYLKDLGIEDA